MSLQQETKKRKVDDDCEIELKPSAPATVIPTKPFTSDVLDKPAEFGVLKELEGTWVSYVGKTGYGIHTTCMPSPGSTADMIPGKFHFLCEDYTEEMKFTLIEGGVRNRAGANEQMIGAVKYEQTIKNRKEKKGIHEEVGMYLYLGDMYKHDATEESVKKDLGLPELKPGDGGLPFVPSHTISRSGTIPHGNSILLLGNDRFRGGKPEWPSGVAAWKEDHLAISRSMGLNTFNPETFIDLDKPAPSWVCDTTLPDRNPSGNLTYTQRILAHELYPYSVRPDLRLRDVIKDQTIDGYHSIRMDTHFNDGEGGPQGGIHNTPLIEKNTPVKRMTLRMWIENVKEGDKVIPQLQYEQIMFFAFGFGTDGGTTMWPHIQVNTLRKIEDVPVCERS